MSLILSDTFTGTNGTALETYNSAWSRAYGSVAYTIVINGNKARYGTYAQQPRYQRSEDPPSADYDVTLEVYVGTVTGQGASQVSVLGRHSTTANTAYNLMLRLPEKEIRLYRVVAGTSTLLYSKVITVTSNTVLTMRLRMVGTQISAIINGASTPLISVTDSGITAAGKCGLATYISDSSATLLEIDNYFAETVDTTPPALSNPSVSMTGSSTADASVTTDDATGTLYYLASTNATEAVDTVKAASSIAVATAGTITVPISSLPANTTMYVHFVHKDIAGNNSVVTTSASFTTPAAAANRGISLTLYNGSTPRASLSSIVALWWNTSTPSGAPALEITNETTDSSGVLSFSIESVTSLPVGQNGFLLLYKLDATDYRDSLVFAGQVTVSDIG